MFYCSSFAIWRTFGIKAAQIIHGNRESWLIFVFIVEKMHTNEVTLRRLQRVLNAYAGADRTGLLLKHGDNVTFTALPFSKFQDNKH